MMNMTESQRFEETSEARPIEPEVYDLTLPNICQKRRVCSMKANFYRQAGRTELSQRYARLDEIFASTVMGLEENRDRPSPSEIRRALDEFEALSELMQGAGEN